jgi:peroxiredoxin
MAEKQLAHRAVMLAIVLLGAAWMWATRLPPGAAGAGRLAAPREGFTAPDFSLENAAGEVVSLEDYRGQVVIVNLWASWCVPCRAEMPAIQALYDRRRAGGLEVLAVNSTVQDSREAASAFAHELGLTFPVLFDRDGAVSQRYRLLALPTTFFVDRQGVIRSVIVGGPMSPAVLESQVDGLLAEAP